MLQLSLRRGAGALIMIAALSATGCASNGKADQKLLEATLRQYASVMRWGDPSQAIAFVDPEVLRANPVSAIELERWKQVQIAGYRERPAEMSGELEARQVAQIDLVNRHTQQVRNVLDMQVWRYDPVAKKWWLMSGLPKLAP